jgi:hypothetical protein
VQVVQQHSTRQRHCNGWVNSSCNYRPLQLLLLYCCSRDTCEQLLHHASISRCTYTTSEPLPQHHVAAIKQQAFQCNYRPAAVCKTQHFPHMLYAHLA